MTKRNNNNNLLWKLSKGILLTGFAALMFTACSSIDCPLNNRVYTKYKLAGDITTLTDSLTVYAELGDGNDPVIINKISNVDSLEIPLSYQRNEDIWLFSLTHNGKEYTDTVTVRKSNMPHFEAVDCQPAIFHHIEGISYTNNILDSIVINNPNVNYDATKSTFYIYFKSDIH